jgi:trehalose 6-phosphate phosphatase
MTGANGKRAGAPVPGLDWAYFFDFDGTLVNIAELPGGIDLDPALRGLLGQLFHSVGGALALISGRAIVDLDRLIPSPHLPAAGQHGIERRDATGRISGHPVPAGRLDEARRRLAETAARHPTLLVEDKGLSLALHYRRAPALAGFAHRLMHSIQADLGDAFAVQGGKRIVELKPAGRDKGDAIHEFMQEIPFVGRTPLFIGDDATDEYGFAMVNRLGGHSVKVGRGPTAATWRLPDVAAVLAWLATGAPPPRLSVRGPLERAR